MSTQTLERLNAAINSKGRRFLSQSAVLVQGMVDETLFDQFKTRKVKNVIVLEGRPQLKAARSSCQKLLKRKITPTVIADNMAGFLFYKKFVKEVWIAYQLADKNGALCEIGALILAVLGFKHHIKVNCYKAAHKTDFIAREQEIFYFNGIRVAPRQAKGYVPLMECVPAKYITKIYERRTKEKI